MFNGNGCNRNLVLKIILLKLMFYREKRKENRKKEINENTLCVIIHFLQF